MARRYKRYSPVIYCKNAGLVVFVKVIKRSRTYAYKLLYIWWFVYEFFFDAKIIAEEIPLLIQ